MNSVATWGLVVALLGLVTVLLRMQRRLARRQQRILLRIDNERTFHAYRGINEYHQLTAFHQLHAFLAPTFVLPPMRNWAISPDFALVLVRLIHEHQPTRIIEFGSGISTILCSYCLQKMGAGEVISIDHDPVFAQKTRDELALHGLSDWADVRVAERRPSPYLDDEKQPIVWYGEDVVTSVPANIDLVIVDGPPSKDNALARYPALPAVFGRLSAGANLVLDDADRAEEQAVLARWQREFPAMRFSHEPTEKGASILSLTADQDS